MELNLSRDGSVSMPHRHFAPQIFFWAPQRFFWCGQPTPSPAEPVALPSFSQSRLADCLSFSSMGKRKFGALEKLEVDL